MQEQRLLQSFIQSRVPSCDRQPCSGSRYSYARALLPQTSSLRLVGRRAAVGAATGAALTLPTQVLAKCKDIESCREVGEAKVAADMAANPIIKLSDGVRYKRVKEGAGATVSGNDVVDIAYSISTAGGSYMYSRGFGFEKDSDGVTLAIFCGSDSDKATMSQRASRSLSAV